MLWEREYYTFIPSKIFSVRKWNAKIFLSKRVCRKTVILNIPLNHVLGKTTNGYFNIWAEVLLQPEGKKVDNKTLNTYHRIKYPGPCTIKI